MKFDFKSKVFYLVSNQQVSTILTHLNSVRGVVHQCF